MGSNMAENHPVGFQFVMEARLRGAKIIHVDPRFTRTSAMSNLHVPIRAGSDIAFLGGIINYILENERYFREYVVHYTNAWMYEGLSVSGAAGRREQGGATGEQAHYGHGGILKGGEPPYMDNTLEHPRCVFQLLKKHFRRYTPEMVEKICGVPREQFLEAA